MEKTKQCCWKELAKMLLLVALITCATWFFIAPFCLGFVATLLNSFVAGRVAEVVVICFGIYLSINVIARGVRRIRDLKQEPSPSEDQVIAAHEAHQSSEQVP